MHVANKLCARCSRTRKGAEEVCEHEGNCTANLPMSASIGDEHAAAKTMVEGMQSDQESAVICYK